MTETKRAPRAPVLLGLASERSALEVGLLLEIPPKPKHKRPGFEVSANGRVDLLQRCRCDLVVDLLRDGEGTLQFQIAGQGAGQIAILGA